MTYWWNFLGELGRVQAISDALEWRECEKPVLLEWVREAPESSGVFRIGAPP